MKEKERYPFTMVPAIFLSNGNGLDDLAVSQQLDAGDFETAVAKENIIVTNAENSSLAGGIGGIAMMTGKTKEDSSKIAYGIMYNATDDLIKLG